MQIRSRGARVFTDDEGRYIVCGLPLERPIDLLVETENGEEGSARVRFQLGIIEVAEFADDVTPYVGYAWEERIWPLDLHIDAAPRTVAFHGTVRDITTSEPLDAVAVVLNGVAIAVTDDQGQFTVAVSLLENQANRISILHAGYQPFHREVTLAHGQTEISLTLSMRPTR